MKGSGSDLILEKTECGGSLDLPNSNWQLILRDRSMPPVGSRRSLERERGSLPESLDKICNDLINVLMKREDLSMGDPKRRTSLLCGFSDKEQNLLERHLIDMQVDVANIVYHVAKRLEKLDKLIGNAMRLLAQNPTTKGQLRLILERYEKNRSRKRRGAKPQKSDLA